MPFEFLSQESQVPGVLQQGTERPEQLGFVGVAKDIALSPFRGIEGFAKSAYDMVDWVAQDILPDSYEGRKLGTSKTFVGGMVEGVSQFALGFALTGPAFKGVQAASKLGQLGVSMARGAAADFVSFDPNEARLSNLLQNFPVMENSVFDYLAASPDDNQAEGRFKNALEGLALGAVTEGLFLGVRALKLRDHGRLDENLLAKEQEIAHKSAELARVEADNALEVERRVKFGFHEVIDEDATGVTIQTDDLSDVHSGPFADKEIPEDPVTGDPIGYNPDETTHFRMADDPDKGEHVVEVLFELGSLKESEIREMAKEHPGASFVEYMKQPDGSLQVSKRSEYHEFTSHVPTEVRKKMNPVINNDQAHRAYKDFSPEAQKSFYEALEQGSITYASGKPVGRHAELLKGVSEDVARKASAAMKGIAETGGVGKGTREIYKELLDSMKTPEDIEFVMTQLPDMVELDSGLRLADIQMAGHRDFKAALNRPGDKSYFDRAIDMAKKNNKNAFKFIKHGMVMQELTVTMAQQASDASKAWLKSGSNEDALAFQGIMEKWNQINKAWDDHKYHAGLALRAVRRDPADGLKVFLDTNMVRKNFAKEAAERDMFQEGNLKKLAEKIQSLGGDPEKMLSELAEQAGKMAKLVDRTKAGRFAGKLEAWYKNALLTNPATNVVNFVGNTTSAIVHTTERYTGAQGKRLIENMKGNKEAAAQYAMLAESATRELRGLFRYSTDAMRAFRSAWEDGGQGTILNTSKMNERGVEHFDPTKPIPMIEKADEESMWQMAQRISQNLKNKTANNVWPVVTIPGRLLGSADEAFKYGQYRASVDAQLWTLGRQNGLSGDELEDYVEKSLEEYMVSGNRAFSEKAFREQAIDIVDAEVRSGTKYTDKERIERIDELHRQADPWQAAERLYQSEKVLDPNAAKARKDAELARLEQMSGISEEARRRALETTFQTRHDHNSAVESIIRWQRNNPRVGPASGFILPFVRTPYNVVRFSLRRLVPIKGIKDLASEFPNLSKAQRSLKAEMDLVHSKDPKLAIQGVEALGRANTTAALLLTAAGLSSQGMLTGAPPQDRRKRDALTATGWQPFSIRIGDTYVSYQRVEPFATVLGMFADIQESRAIQAVNPAPDWEEGYMGALVTSIAANVTDKTFFSGMSAFFEAATSGSEQKLNRVIGNLVTPFVTPPGMAALNRTLSDDGALREVRTITDMMLGKMPGTSQTLDPRRNVLGEALSYDINPVDIINPFYHSTHKNDPILDELQSMGTGVDLPRSQLSPEVDLKEWRTPDNMRTLADVREELVGTVKVGGKTLRQSLRDLMATSRYKQLSNVGPMGDFRDPRSHAFSNVINKYRKAATKQLLRENDDLREALTASKKLSHQLRAGRISSEIAFNFMNPQG